MTESREDRLARAKGYPYEVPKASYLLFEGRTVTERGHTVNDMAKRKPVLAYGSNAAPGQLMRKFAKTLKTEMIPVFKVILPGFDVVYSARFSRYGAIPAALAVLLFIQIGFLWEISAIHFRLDVRDWV